MAAKIYLIGSSLFVLLLLLACGVVFRSPTSSGPASGMGKALLLWVLLWVMVFAYSQMLIGSLLLWRLGHVDSAKFFFFGYAGVVCAALLAVAVPALLDKADRSQSPVWDWSYVLARNVDYILVFGNGDSGQTITKVRWALKLGGSVGRQGLSAAVTRTDGLDVFKYLVDEKTFPLNKELPGEFPGTPLSVVCSEGNAAAASLLLNAGADPDTSSPICDLNPVCSLAFGWRPAYAKGRQERMKILDLLLEAGLDAKRAIDIIEQRLPEWKADQMGERITNEELRKEHLADVGKREDFIKAILLRLRTPRRETMKTVDSSNPRPPAPFIGPSLGQTVHKLKTGAKLPLSLGRYSPQAMIDKREGGYVLYRLEPDAGARKKAAEEHEKQGYYVPEMDWKSLREGKTLASAAYLDEFIELVKKNWDPEWGPREE